MKWLAFAYAMIGCGISCIDYSNFPDIPGAIGIGLLTFGVITGVTLLIMQLFKYLEPQDFND
jgi:hypothetical protein